MSVDEIIAMAHNNKNIIHKKSTSNALTAAPLTTSLRMDASQVSNPEGM